MLEAELDWFDEAELEGWFEEAELDGWLLEVEAEDDGWLDEAEAEEDGWFIDDDWLAEPEVEAWLLEPALADWLDEPDAPPAEARPGMSALACLAWSIAAWVLGPILPSTAPGSKPLSFSACWSWRTDSSPCAMLLALFALVAPFVEAEAAGWFAEADWLAEAELDGWFAVAETAGWLAELDFSVEDWPAAMAEPAAIRAAARASFLNSMDVILSYTKRGDTGRCRALPFGALRARKLQRCAAPTDARFLRTASRG